ncbi:MAG: Wzz/FepE/Etk N-terminal domain-containing protein, partial [Longimicrobiales bacterium]|nr:Wzz/FepE/Etk N-terminal domain-containing protein [Longimicrobiales bacterium]
MDQPSGLTNGAGSEDEIHLRDVWNLLVRNWWVIGLSLVGVVGATAAYTLRMVPVYESVTTIRIQEQRSELPVLDILQTLSTGSEVETEMEVVRSRTLAEDVVDSLGLQIGVVSPRGVARVALIRSVFVERWAPAGVYTLTRLPDGSYGITNQEDGAGLGPVSATVAA